MKSDFLPMISHELRHAAHGHHRLHRSAPAAGPRRPERPPARYQDVGQESGPPSAAIVNDLLDLNRLDGGHLTIAGDRVLADIVQ